MKYRNLSPLRYPGGKLRIIELVENIISKNHLKSYTYCEPYAGGAGLALTMLQKGIVQKIHLNDLDRSIYSFWYSILNNTEEFIRLIVNTEVSIEEREKQKEVQNNIDKAEVLDLGFSTFYLNRVNRSGILKGGVIGGKGQKSNYSIDCRFNKVELIGRIIEIASLKKRIKLTNMDAIDLIHELKDKKKVFMYLDPPYYKKGKDLYMNYYNHDDHLNLANVLQDSSLKYIISYDDCKEIRNIYNKQKHIKYTLSHNVSNKGIGKEIMYFSKNITRVK